MSERIEIGRCRDCRHWTAEPKDPFDRPKGPEGYGACGFAGFTGDFSYSGEGFQPAPTAPAVVVSDDDPYIIAWLATRPDFGCVGFAAREEQP